MADTMAAALAAAGFLRSNPPAARQNREATRYVPPRREVTHELPPIVRLALKSALARKDLSGVVWFSDHAVDRFRERFEADSGIEEARALLTARASRRGRWYSARPQWVRLEPGAGYDPPLENVGYLVAVGRRGDDEIVLPLVFTTTKPEPLAAATCLYPTPARTPVPQTK